MRGDLVKITYHSENIETGEKKSYKTINEAAMATGVPHATIQKGTFPKRDGDRRTGKGYYWSRTVERVGHVGEYGEVTYYKKRSKQE